MTTEARASTTTSPAQFSTAPITPETTLRSATNATKLGFYAKQAVLLTPEDHQAFEALTVAFRFELHPAGPVERALYTQILLAAWNIERANRLEAALAADGADPLLSGHHAKRSTASPSIACARNLLSTNASRKYRLTKPPIRSMNPFCGTKPNRFNQMKQRQGSLNSP